VSVVNHSVTLTGKFIVSRTLCPGSIPGFFGAPHQREVELGKPAEASHANLSSDTAFGLIFFTRAFDTQADKALNYGLPSSPEIPASSPAFQTRSCRRVPQSHPGPVSSFALLPLGTPFSALRCSRKKLWPPPLGGGGPGLAAALLAIHSNFYRVYFWRAFGLEIAPFGFFLVLWPWQLTTTLYTVRACGEVRGTLTLA